MMFDTLKVARRIRQARIEQNMTQMVLADKLGISYQAVSNWERGNSMPDISKLEELCGILKISIADLLGQDAQQEAQTIQRILESDQVSDEELTRVAPVLTPRQITGHIHKKAKYGVSGLSGLAPFLDAKTLGELAEGMEVEDLYQLSELALYLDEDTTDGLIEKFDGPVDDLYALTGLAPFASQRSMDRLVQRYEGSCDIYAVAELAPFLSRTSLDQLVSRIGEVGDLYTLSGLAPFVAKETLGALVERKLGEGDYHGVECLAAFLPKETLHKAAKLVMEQKDLETLQQIIAFV